MHEQFELFSRNGKQCRERYQVLVEAVKAEWNQEEEAELYRLHEEVGNKWVLIGQRMGKTDNCVKNHFFSKLRKSVRKLNRVIHEHFRSQFREIRLLLVNKLIEATDEKFKALPTISPALINLSVRTNLLMQDLRTCY